MRWARKVVSSVSRNRLAYAGAILVPIAVPWTCRYIWELNSKMLCLRIASSMVWTKARSNGSSYKCMSAAEGQEIAVTTVKTLEGIRTDECFDLFWLKVNGFVSAHEIADPKLPRRRKQPRRLDDGLSSGDFHESPKQYYKQQYFKRLTLSLTVFPIALISQVIKFILIWKRLDDGLSSGDFHESPKQYYKQQYFKRLTLSLTVFPIALISQVIKFILIWKLFSLGHPEGKDLKKI